MRALLAAVAILAACGKSAPPPPPGLGPIDDLTVADPAPVGGDAHPEALSLVSGSTAEFDFAHGHGFVKAGLADVWSALKAPAVVVDRRKSVWTSAPAMDATAPVAFTVHNTVHDVVTVDFDVLWREGALSGRTESPDAIGVRGEKTAGTTLIQSLVDSFIVRPIDDATSTIDVVCHVSSAGNGRADCEQYVKDAYASVVARVHGRPLPTY